MIRSESGPALADYTQFVWLFYLFFYRVFVTSYIATGYSLARAGEGCSSVLCLRVGGQLESLGGGGGGGGGGGWLQLNVMNSQVSDRGR